MQAVDRRSLESWVSHVVSHVGGFVRSTSFVLVCIVTMNSKTRQVILDATRPHRRNVCRRHYNIHTPVHIWPWPLFFDLSVRIRSVVSICVSSGSNPSAAHELSSSQDFHGRHCVTLNFDGWPMTWEIISAIRTHAMNVCGKFHTNLSSI